jgi:hypothetical protein
MGQILGAMLIILTLLLIVTTSYLIYENLPGETQELSIERNADENLPMQPSKEIQQFFPNIRFNHNNITYHFTEECTEKRREKMLQAFQIIEEKTGIITFAESNEPDILVSCSEEEMRKEKNLFVAGEGGPSELINLSLYSVILKGRIYLYKSSSCDYPVVELHELLHVFGFDHVDNPDLIMHPYANCEQRIHSSYINFLVNLYSVEPLPDLYFESAKMTKSGRYLNFEVIINNQGMIDAKNVSLWVMAEGNKIAEFQLKEIKFGAGKKFWAENLKLPSRGTENIELKIVSVSKEFIEENNIVRASI